MHRGNALIGDIFQQLSRIDTVKDTHPTSLENLASPDHDVTKAALLTLHFLFPHELLPALDLIDRGLITILRSNQGAPSHCNESLSDHPTKGDIGRLEAILVRSASSTSSNRHGELASGRFRDAYSKSRHSYEVNVSGWNCTCPAFSYSTLKLLTGVAGVHGEQHKASQAIEFHEDGRLPFGGISVKPDSITPICKHILAVYLAMSAPRLFGHGIQKLEVDQTEIAGWLHV